MLKQHENLYVANGPCFRINSLKGTPLLVAMFLSWSFQSRGPWLLNRLCCPVGSMLTMTSSETLDSSFRLIFFVLAGLCPTVSYGLKSRGSPIYSACLFHRAISGTPALRSVAVAVTSPIVLAFAISAEAQQAHPTHVGSHVGRVTRLHLSSLVATAR